MLYLIRHGETEKNKAHVLQGRSNEPLNAAGAAAPRLVSGLPGAPISQME